MAKKRSRTQLRDKSKDHCDAVRIIDIDEAENTVHATVNGCNVTVICRKQANPDIYDRVKDILIGTVIN